MPHTIPAHINAVTPQIELVQGENLISLYVYTEGVNLSWDALTTRFHLLLILKICNKAALDRLIPFQKRLSEQGIGIKLFTESEIRTSLDVFPIEFLDMKLRHQLLAGTDILAPLDVDPVNLRHECEFNLRTSILKLREFYLVNPKKTWDLMHESLPAFMAVFRNLLRLKKQDAPKTGVEIIEALTRELKFDKTVFLTLLTTIKKCKNSDALFGDYLAQLELILQQVDRLLK